MEQSLQAELTNFFQKFTDLSDRAVKHWPLHKSSNNAEEDEGIGYEFRTIVTRDEFKLDRNQKLIDSFFKDLCQSDRLFNGSGVIPNRKEIEADLADKNPFERMAGPNYSTFQKTRFLIIGHIPDEECARAACIGIYFYYSQTIFIDSIWLADELQKEEPPQSSGKVENLLVEGLLNEHERLEGKLRERNKEQNRQTVLSWMLTYWNQERDIQSGLLTLIRNARRDVVKGVFLEVENPVALITTPRPAGFKDDVEWLNRAANRLSAFHEIDARYIKFAYEQPGSSSVATGKRTYFLLTLPQVRKKGGALVIESNIVMQFIIDYTKLLLEEKYADSRYDTDFKNCNSFVAGKLTSMQGVQNGDDIIARNNHSLFDNRLSEHKTLLYLHSIPRLETPRFAYRRSSVGFEILVDEDYFEPQGLDPYHNMSSAEPARTRLGTWLAVARKELFKPKHTVAKVLYCPVAHSGETDLFAYKYQSDPPYFTRYYENDSIQVEVEFPSHFEFTSEGRMENFYRMPETDEQFSETKKKKQREDVQKSMDRGDELPQFTYSVRMEACVSYTYFLKSAVRVWHLVLKPLTDENVSELEIIKLMRFFSGSQEHKDDEERRESVRRIKFKVTKAPESPEKSQTSIDPELPSHFIQSLSAKFPWLSKATTPFAKFLFTKFPWLKFTPAAHYHEEERKAQKQVWRAKIVYKIFLWPIIGLYVVVTSLFKETLWSWLSAVVDVTYWLIGFLLLRIIWQLMAGYVIPEIRLRLRRIKDRLLLKPEPKTDAEKVDEPDNLIQLLHDLTGVFYKENVNRQFDRQLDDADKVVSLRNVRSGVVEIDTGDVFPASDDDDANEEMDAKSFLGFYENKTEPRIGSLESGKLTYKIPLAKRNEIRSKVKELYRDLYEGNIQMEADPEPFTAEEYADYVFKSYCGICLGIFDYDRMGFQEIDDTLVPLADSKTEDSFMVIHRGVLAMLGHDDDVMDTFWNTLGINAYLLIPSALLAHNDMVSRDADTRLDKLLKDIREGHSRLSVRQLNLERNHIDDLLNDDILGNVFQYKTEQEIYEQGMKRRGITDRIKDAQSKLEQLEKLINEKHDAGSTRYQRRITFLATLVSIFSFYEYVRNYFQNELAVEDPANSKIKQISYEDIPLLFKTPAELIDRLTKPVKFIPQILPDEGCYDPLYLAHIVIWLLFALLIGYLLIINLADPGRNKKYFWQRTTTRSRSLPKTNVPIPKTRSRSAR